MKAFVFTEKGKIEEKQLPEAKLNEELEEDRYAAILKPLYVSPCSSDVHTVFAGAGPRRADLILGHEGIAEITAVGSEVKDFKIGDIVAVCAVMPEPGDIAGHKGMPFSATKLGRNIDGMWAERFKVPMADINLANIPDGVSMEAALMAVDMMATGFTAAEEADIEEGMSVLIIGSGAVGLMAAAGAMQKGAWRTYVIGTDKSTANIDAAAAFGADAYISYRDGHLIFADDEAKEAFSEWDSFKIPHKDPRANSVGSKAVDTIFALTRGEGVDRVLICGGGHGALAEACDCVKYGGGTVVNVSYIEGSGSIELPIFSLGRGMSGKNFKFCLSRGGRAWTEKMLNIAFDLEKNQSTKLDLYENTDNVNNIESEEQSPGRLVTHRLYGFDSIPEGLRLMHERPAGLIKIMIETGL